MDLGSVLYKCDLEISIKKHKNKKNSESKFMFTQNKKHQIGTNIVKSVGIFSDISDSYLYTVLDHF